MAQKDYLTLKVTKDSMNGFGIDKGDTVSILILSKNSSYKPIQMKREDITIIGKVIGVLGSVN